MNKDKIKALSQRTQARQEVDVWFQSNENYLHPIREISANGSDEMYNNFDDGTLTLELFDDCQTVRITDMGRGLPINGKAVVEDDDGNMVEKETWYLLLQKLFSGTNYDNNEHKKITTGKHGLGLTVSNYCSTYFKVESYQVDKMYDIVFENGGVVSKPLEEHDISNGQHGTSITFKLDPEIFTCITYNIEDLKDIYNKLACANRKNTFVVKHKGETFTYHYDSLEEYYDTISSMDTSKKIIGNPKLYMEENENNTIELVMTTSSEPKQESYLNMTYLVEGGTIVEGVVSGVKSVVNKYCKSKNLLTKKEGNIGNNDILDSISFVCNFLSTKASFANQTKFSTRKSLYKKITQEYVSDLLEVFMTEDPDGFDKFCKHILTVKKFNSKADNDKKKLKKELSEKITILNKIEGLYEAECKNPEESILCICEGKSALSSLLDGRRSVHAIFPLRGKILNCSKASLNSILSNEVIKKLILALGCGVEMESLNKKKIFDLFDINRLRYSKVYIFVDQDIDGIGSIMPLLLTMFYVLTPTLIKEGRICVCESPKYEIDYIDGKEEKELFATSDEELEQIKKELDYENNKNKFKIHYIKG